MKDNQFRQLANDLLGYTKSSKVDTWQTALSNSKNGKAESTPYAMILGLNKDQIQTFNIFLGAAFPQRNEYCLFALSVLVAFHSIRLQVLAPRLKVNNEDQPHWQKINEMITKKYVSLLVAYIDRMKYKEKFTHKASFKFNEKDTDFIKATYRTAIEDYASLATPDNEAYYDLKPYALKVIAFRKYTNHAIAESTLLKMFHEEILPHFFNGTSFAGKTSGELEALLKGQHQEGLQAPIAQSETPVQPECANDEIEHPVEPHPAGLIGDDDIPHLEHEKTVEPATPTLDSQPVLDKEDTPDEVSSLNSKVQTNVENPELIEQNAVQSFVENFVLADFPADQPDDDVQITEHMVLAGMTAADVYKDLDLNK